MNEGVIALEPTIVVLKRNEYDRLLSCEKAWQDVFKTCKELGMEDSCAPAIQDVIFFIREQVLG